MRFFGNKIRKFLKLEKLENMMAECIFKKCLYHFKSFLYKNGKVENMPAVAGRLVYILVKIDTRKKFTESQ